MTYAEYYAVLKELKEIIKGTKWERHIFSVGGCVRDYIMEYPIKDIDIVVDLPNGGIDFALWLYGNNYITRGPITYPTYGTAMFKLVKFPELELEAVETRKEQYKDKESRNPDVVYGTLAEDCIRRDLTINALYYDITTDRIIDLVGGQEDIQNKIIRTPSNPDVIFSDDPLRMLRVIRFATRYGWSISEETLEGIMRNVKRMKIITQERITDEMIKTLIGAKQAGDAWHLWYNCGLLQEILPEINNEELYLDKIKKHLDHLSGLTTVPEMFFAAIFIDYLDVLKRMKLSNDFINLVTKLVSTQQWIYTDANSSEVREFGFMYGKDYPLCMNFLKSLVVSTFGSLDSHIKVYEFEKRIKILEDEGTMFNEKTVLPIDGYDIMVKFKLNPSIKVKELLVHAWNIFYSEPYITKKELLERIKTCI